MSAERLCPIIVETVLKKHNFAITETAHELAIRCDELHLFLEQYGIPKGPETHDEFVLDPKAELEKAISLLEGFVSFVEHSGDFRNGVVDNGVDEGQVAYSNTLYILDRKLKHLKNRNNL